ncbi:hypothetical protein D3C85_1595980 [compost metagenome]
MYVATSLPLLNFVQVRVAVIFRTEQARVAILAKLVHVGLELRLGDNLDAE